MSTPMSESQPEVVRGRFLAMPITRLGWWAGGLFVAALALFLINSLVFMPPAINQLFPRAFLIFYGLFTMLCGLSAGIVGLIALIRNRERSWFVWLTILPFAFWIFFLIGEFLFPH